MTSFAVRVVELKREIKRRDERIRQLEEALRRVDKLLDPVALPDEAQRVIRAALSASEARKEE